MKRFIASLIFFAATAAQAHVLLTTPLSYAGTGTTAFNAPHCTMTGSQAIAGSNGKIQIIMITYSFGTATFAGGVDTAFTVAPGAPQMVNSLNMTTGAWTMSWVGGPNGGAIVGQGVLSTPQLTGAAAAYAGTFVSLMDFADYFLTLSGAGLLSTPMGTQPDLWQLGDQ
jgi:hypothetical protein